MVLEKFITIIEYLCYCVPFTGANQVFNFDLRSHDNALLISIFRVCDFASLF